MRTSTTVIAFESVSNVSDISCAILSSFWVSFTAKRWSIFVQLPHLVAETHNASLCLCIHSVIFIFSWTALLTMYHMWGSFPTLSSTNIWSYHPLLRSLIWDNSRPGLCWWNCCLKKGLIPTFGFFCTAFLCPEDKFWDKYYFTMAIEINFK